MMGLLQVLIGLGLVCVSYRAHLRGEIRAGSAGFRRYTPTRGDSPVAFHIFLLLYLCSGFALIVWGVFAMLGMAEPMPVA